MGLLQSRSADIRAGELEGAVRIVACAMGGFVKVCFTSEPC